jgi:hypothetical protein
MVLSSSFLLLLTGATPVLTLRGRYRGGVRGFSINDEESVKSVKSVGGLHRGEIESPEED